MPANGQLSAAQRRTLAGPPLSNAFDAHDRLFADWSDGAVFDYGSLDTDDGPRAMAQMLRRDGNARKLEQVLTLPLRGADHEIRGDGPAADLVRGNVGPMLNRLIEQATGACVYRRAFFERTWRLDGSRVLYDDIAWRPPGSCEAAWRPDTAAPDGFRQRIALHGAVVTAREGRGTLPGYVRVPAERAWVFTHGRHREPVNGVSDLDVALWAYETRQKLLFLWFQYLENQSLPKTVAYGDDQPQADRHADAIADLRSSGVLGLVRPHDPTARAWEVLEASGRGADQFAAAIKYLESQQTSSVLANFTDLADSAAAGRGSYALSADQSEFFLASRQAVADEIAEAITEDVIRPLVVYNFGPDAAVPSVHIGPIGNRQTDRALTLLQGLLTAERINAPDDFVRQLLTYTAAFLGLDADRLHDAVDGWAPAPPTPRDGRDLSAAVDLAHRLVAAARAGTDPADALVDLTGCE